MGTLSILGKSDFSATPINDSPFKTTVQWNIQREIVHSWLPLIRHGQDQTEFDDLISALRSPLRYQFTSIWDWKVTCRCHFNYFIKTRTGDVFGENIDKFKRNRKSRTSPPRWSSSSSSSSPSIILMSNAKDDISLSGWRGWSPF